MPSQQNSIFDLSIKAGCTVIVLPVYENDNDELLIQRLQKKYPKVYSTQCTKKIKCKIIESLKNIQRSYNTSHKLKLKIADFLQNCKFQYEQKLNSLAKDQNKQSQSKKKSKNKNQKKIIKNSEISQKQNQGKLHQFTKLYQITKSIFQKSKKPLSQSLQKLLKKFVSKSSSIGKAPRNGNRKKQSDSLILQRIQNKLQTYENKNAYNCTANMGKNLQNLLHLQQTQNLSQSHVDLTVITEPLNQFSQRDGQGQRDKDKLGKTQRGQHNLSSRARFRYNYQDIIKDRKIFQTKLRRYCQNKDQTEQIRNSHSMQPSQQHSFSRSYDFDTFSGLRKNYYRIDSRGNLGYASVRQRQNSIPRFQYLNEQVCKQKVSVNKSRLEESKKISNSVLNIQSRLELSRQRKQKKYSYI